LLQFRPVSAAPSNHYIDSFSSLQRAQGCISEVERIEEQTSSRATDSSSKKEEWLTIKEEEEKK
jgi:hypothetical protein